MTNITPCLWFDHQAEEAVDYYCSVFRRAKMGEVVRAGRGIPVPEGSVLYATFELDGQRFLALNGGSEHRFTPAVSFFARCADQAEVDELWDWLLEGGEPQQCGWLTDKFGVTWQVVPEGLDRLLYSPDAEKSSRAMQAMLKMVKLDIEKIRAAYDGLE